MVSSFPISIKGISMLCASVAVVVVVVCDKKGGGGRGGKKVVCLKIVRKIVFLFCFLECSRALPPVSSLSSLSIRQRLLRPESQPPPVVVLLFLFFLLGFFAGSFPTNSRNDFLPRKRRKELPHSLPHLPPPALPLFLSLGRPQASARVDAAGDAGAGSRDARVRKKRSSTEMAAALWARDRPGAQAARAGVPGVDVLALEGDEAAAVELS